MNICDLAIKYLISAFVISYQHKYVYARIMMNGDYKTQIDPVKTADGAGQESTQSH